MSIKSIQMPHSAAPIDGPIDVTMNVNYLRVDVKEVRRGQYLKYVNSNKQLITAAGTVLPFTLNLSRANLFHYQVKKWLKDGQVSVAQNACSLCIEINSLRPSNCPPLCCLVRSKTRLDSTDATAACALCYSIGHFSCSSQAKFPSITATLGRSASIELGRSSSLSRAVSVTGSHGHGDGRSFLRFPPPEMMASNDDTLGAMSAPDNFVKNRRRQYNYSNPSRPMSRDGSYDRGMAPSFGIDGRKRTLSEMANRRKAHFIKTSDLEDQLEAIEVLTSQMDNLQVEAGRERERSRGLEQTVKAQTNLISDLLKKSDQCDISLGKLQAGTINQSNVDFHLARLVEIVDGLQKSINDQKQDVQAMKHLYNISSTRPRNSLSPLQQRRFSADEPSSSTNSLETLKKSIEENEEKQRQRKALYLEQLNMEVARTMAAEGGSSSTNTLDDLLPPRRIDL